MKTSLRRCLKNLEKVIDEGEYSYLECSRWKSSSGQRPDVFKEQQRGQLREKGEVLENGQIRNEIEQ